MKQAAMSKGDFLNQKNYAKDELYVFISYAREDAAVAKIVEEFLTATGIRIFRDTQILSSEDWDMTIERALRECQRMVLLLSPSSMPDRKEVRREWFHFNKTGKPIHPLYIQNCELHTRLSTTNYIDARNDLPSALVRLLNDLRTDIPLRTPLTDKERITIVESAEPATCTLPDSLNALFDAVRNPEGSVVLSVAQAKAIKDHEPTDLTEYRLGRIAEWSLPEHQMDRRFVNLTMILDKGDKNPQRWQKAADAEDFRFNELRDVLDQTEDDPALVLLGAPGSGKSTLLRRLQLDHSIDRLRDGGDVMSFFIQLNQFRPRANGRLPEPREWLGERWKALYPELQPLETWLQKGCALLLLDAFNEMPHKSTENYYALVAMWRAFVQEASGTGNQIVFSCRSLDYSASLSGPELRVPQVEVQPLNEEQVRTFLHAYTPDHEERVWRELYGSSQFSLFQTPYFLKLLCAQVEVASEVPNGRAALFTGFVRQVLHREIHSELFQSLTLLSEMDRQKLSLDRWRNAFELPERGTLITKLSNLAFSMQKKGPKTEAAQVRIGYDDACALVGEQVLQAGEALNLLDRDVAQEEIFFFHQLLQEYFAARRLAKAPDPSLVHVEWAVDQVHPALQDTLTGLVEGEPLQLLPQTGWEETTLTAAPMAESPQAFIRDLIPHNLPIAARCAASPEVHITAELKHEIQNALIVRSQDMRSDLRARIAAGEALGEIGDPRFELRTGPHGGYLFPPLVDISGGIYQIGSDDDYYAEETPAHTVDLAPFQIGQFPVTNAEYTLFMAADGYKDEQWWDTPEALAWLRGEGSVEGNKRYWREYRKKFQVWSEGDIHERVARKRITSRQAEEWITLRNWDDQRFEMWLDETFPSVTVFRQPGFWDDTRFNNKSQPVVGVTWFEARAYCNWLTASVGSASKIFRLPTEVEVEAAARGKVGGLYAYGEMFDASRSNTFESHISRTTPVGIFNNATPEGVFDLSGNAFTWTLSIYDHKHFPYPYRSDDGREDINKTDALRVRRGGSWNRALGAARAAYRTDAHPARRDDSFGFRVVCVQHSLSL